MQEVSSRAVAQVMAHPVGISRLIKSCQQLISHDFNETLACKFKFEVRMSQALQANEGNSKRRVQGTPYPIPRYGMLVTILVGVQSCTRYI